MADSATDLDAPALRGTIRDPEFRRRRATRAARASHDIVYRAGRIGDVTTAIQVARTATRRARELALAAEHTDPAVLREVLMLHEPT